MATPQPQTGSSLPGRTTAQPARPVGQAASGEKDLLTDLRPADVRPAEVRPVNLGALASPPPRPTVVPAVAPTERSSARVAEAAAEIRSERTAPTTAERIVSTPPERTASAAAERPVAKAAAIPPAPPATREKREATAKDGKDWGLAPARPRGSVTGKIAGAVALAAIAAGGYFGYMKFAPPTTGAPGAGELADTETTAGTRSTFSDSESGDPFDDSPTEQPLKGTKETPRLAHHTPDAIPIQAVGEPA
ncbi:MAG TPA: hypothetical protein VL475_05245, partial [Planctomycetaceae bacterium]|nr:hypothetical protein [Planctomycetaceae bacterium]